MEYYVVIEGQKQGPFDLLSLIKKVRNGTLTRETLVSDNLETGFRPAVDFEELKPILKQGSEVGVANRMPSASKFSLKDILSEGVDLWARRVVSYTIGAGSILAIGFAVSFTLKQVQILADFPVVINYVVSVLITSLFCLFFNFVLITKRAQEIDYKDIANAAKESLPRILIFSALFSIYTLLFGINIKAGILGLGIVLMVSTFLIFVPFLIQDAGMGLRDAARVSIDRVKTIGSEGFGVILALVAINLAVAVVPAMISKNLFVFGLFISIPLTTAAIAHVYDRVFA